MLSSLNTQLNCQITKYPMLLGRVLERVNYIMMLDCWCYLPSLKARSKATSTTQLKVIAYHLQYSMWHNVRQTVYVNFQAHVVEISLFKDFMTLIHQVWLWFDKLGKFHLDLTCLRSLASSILIHKFDKYDKYSKFSKFHKLPLR